MARLPNGLSALFAKSAFEFSDKPTTLSTTHVTHQELTSGALRALTTSGRRVSRPAVGRGFGEGRVGPAFSEKPTAFLSKSDGGQGASCVFIKGKGPQGVGRRKTSDSIHETVKAVYQCVNEFQNPARFQTAGSHIRSHVL